MSSSISADYSPTSNHSHPTDFSVSPPPTTFARNYAEQAPPPRLSSPHIFRDIFAGAAAGPSIRSPPRLPPLHEINFNETMQDVNRALQSANRAIQNAQEAFQSRRTPSLNTNGRQDVVDLTNSPPSPLRNEHAYDSFLTRTLHPHDSFPANRLATHSLNEPFYPRTNSSLNGQSLFVEEDDPTSPYAGQSDSLAGARRRFEQAANRRRSYITIPNMERTLMRSGMPATRRQEEEEAIRRQRVAREQWEQNRYQQQQRSVIQRQQLPRQAEEAVREQGNNVQLQRDQHVGNTSLPNDYAQGSSQNSQPGNDRTNTNAFGFGSTLHTSSPSLHRSPGSASSSSVEAVDLTTVNNKTDLAAALVHSQASNQMANPAAPTGEPRSALTAYKCPICLEPPRNATSTICGHLFCHECIIETLKNSENMRREDAPAHRKVKGVCPVCRKELARKEEEGNGRTLVPLEIKLISRKKMEELRQQEKKRQRESENGSKGKGKERSTDSLGQEILELSSDEEDDWGFHRSGQNENKAKRIKLSASEELDQELFGSFVNDSMTG